MGRLADISVIDRDTGRTLTPYLYHGGYWIAGRSGARYAIAVHNQTGERILAVTSVDGVNIVTGAAAGWDQGGYVFGPGEGYELTGWRKSDAEVAAFAFTPCSNSYAARTGRAANVGVIGIALFRERPALPIPAISKPQKLGTAHGARENSHAERTAFERQQTTPNEIITLRYDSLENLVAMGVVPGRLYVPDPPG